MPNDILVIAPLVSAGLNPGQLHGVGATQFIFEPYQNDVQFDGLRNVMILSGTTKLVQSIMRIMLTPVGTSLEDARWGADLSAGIGSKMGNDNFSQIRQSVIDALTHYNDVNQDNPNSDEVINTIDELLVVNDIGDPRVIRVVLGITTESGIGIKIVAPQVTK